MPRLADIRISVASILLLSAAVARADSDHLVVGTHDAALASALSVAVSPRGLSVVELPEPLGHVADAPEARRLIAVPGTVAVVWLCDDDAATHALCFCGRDGRLSVKPISVASPLSPPDAAAVALSVKMLLGAPLPPAPPPPPPPAPPPAPISTPPAALPALVVGATLGARLQSTAEQHASGRLGLEGVFAPEAFERLLGLGIDVGAGTALAAGGALPAPGARRTLNDLTLGLTARGRLRLQAPWLELAVGPSAHVLSVATGAAAPRRTDASLDAHVSANLPLGRASVGVRAGGFAMLTSPSASNVQLPRWNGEALLIFGLVLR